MISKRERNNDLEMLDRLPMFQRLRTGRWPPVHPDTIIGAFSLLWLFYLTDSIYPRWRIFVITYFEITNRKQKNFGAQQEAVRKSVERLFGSIARI
jgi:Plant transposon protein